MATPFAGPPTYITDAAGLPVNGALIYTYEAGTLVPKAAFTTSAKNVAQTNPIVATNGRATFFLGTGSYRIRVFTADGLTELTAYACDNIVEDGPDVLVQLANSASTILGDALLGVKTTAVGAVATTVHEVNERKVSTFDFMTAAQIADVLAGTYLLDCRAAVQAAVAAAIAGGIRKISAPGRAYMIRSVASADTVANGILFPFSVVNSDPVETIVFEGDGGTAFKCGDNTMMLFRMSRNCVTLRGITLDFNNKTGVVLCGIVPESMTQTTTLVSNSFVTLDNVNRIGGAGVDGIVFQPGPRVGGSDSGCFYHNIIGGYSNFVGGGRHVHGKKGSTWATDANRVTRTNFIGQRLTRGNAAYHFEVGSEISLIGCNEETINSGVTPLATPTARHVAADCSNIVFVGGYSETCTTSVNAVGNGNVRSYGYVPASGSDATFIANVHSWGDSVNDSRTFTPVLASSTGGAQGAGTVVGKATKHGKTVSVTVQISLAKGTLGAAGTMSISGLPFIAATAWASQNLEVTSWSGITLGTNYVKLNALLSGATITIQKQHGQGAGVTGLLVSDCADPIILTIQGSYEAA